MVRVWLQPVTVTVTEAVAGVKGPGVAVFLICRKKPNGEAAGQAKDQKLQPKRQIRGSTIADVQG
jgi:hypothetical protein